MCGVRGVLTRYSGSESNPQSKQRSPLYEDGIIVNVHLMASFICSGNKEARVLQHLAVTVRE